MEPWENLLLNNFSGAISPQLPDLAKHRIVISQEELNNQERRRKEVLRSLSQPPANISVSAHGERVQKDVLIPQSVINESPKIKSWQGMQAEGLAAGLKLAAATAEENRRKKAEERQQILARQLVNLQQGSNPQEVLAGFKNLNSDNYPREQYLKGDYSSLTNNSTLAEYLKSETDEAKLGFALRKFMFSTEKSYSFIDKMDMLIKQLGRDSLKEEQKNKILNLVNRDLANGVYPALATETESRRVLAEDKSALAILKTLGSLDSLIETASMQRQLKGEPLTELAGNLVNAFSEKLKGKYVSVSWSDSYQVGMPLEMARGLKILGINTEHENLKTMAVNNLNKLLTENVSSLNNPNKSNLNQSMILEQATQVIDLIQGLAKGSIDAVAHVQPAKEALIELTQALVTNKHRSANTFNLFQHRNGKDGDNLLKIFQFLYANDKYPANEEVLNKKQSVLHNLNLLSSSVEKVGSLAEGTINFQDRLTLMANSELSQKNLLERNQDNLTKMAEIVDSLMMNSGDKPDLLNQLRMRLIQSVTMLEQNPVSSMARDKEANLTIQQLMEQERNNAGKYMFPESGLKDSWQMLLNLQKLTNYLNTEASQSEFSQAENLKNMANTHLDEMVKELLERNNGFIVDFTEDAQSISPFQGSLKAEDIQLSSRIYPQLTTDNVFALFGQDEKARFLSKLNDKFCDAVNDRTLGVNEKKGLVLAYKNFLETHIVSHDEQVGVYALKGNNARYLVNRSIADDWQQMKILERLPGTFSERDEAKKAAKDIVTMMSLVTFGQPGFLENLINDREVWSSTVSQEDKLKLQADDLRLFARVNALYTEGFRFAKDDSKTTENLTKLKNKIVETLENRPKDVLTNINSFEAVLKECFHGEDGQPIELNENSPNYTTDLIKLIEKAFDPLDKSIQAKY